MSRSRQAAYAEQAASAKSSTNKPPPTSEANANRDVLRMCNRWGLSMGERHDVLTYRTEEGVPIELPIVKPSSWLRCLLFKHSPVIGGGSWDFQRQNWAFWKCYQAIHPGHEIYQDPSDERLRTTFPVMLFGDEGRYLKRGNFMVCSIEPVLGSTPTKVNDCNCSCDPVLDRYPGILEDDWSQHDESLQEAARVAAKQYTNYAGHCFLSKFVCFGVASQLYRKHKGLLEKAFAMVSEDLTALHRDGLTLQGRTFYFSVLGVKGDLKFHHQLGHLTRSYYNVGTTKNHAICSFCMAGVDGCPFEDTSSEAKWRDTMFCTKPWLEDQPPIFATIPYDRLAQEDIFKLDPFHVWKMGTCRDLTGSLIISLCLLEYFDFDPAAPRNLDFRVEVAFGHFSLWCKAEHKTPSLHYFSKQMFCISNQRQFPWSNVKGSDNTLLTLWLRFFLKNLKRTNGFRLEHGALLNAGLEALESATVFWDILNGHKLWLSRHCAQRLEHHLVVMMRAFKVCAREARQLQIVAFSLKPKLHALDHIRRNISQQIQDGAPLILSPLAFACEANEDVVGKASRLARRVSSRTVSSNLLTRISLKTKALVRKRKFQGPRSGQM